LPPRHPFSSLFPYTTLFRSATGGGLALTLGSDVRIAAASARFGVAFVRIGLSGCDIGVSWALPRLIGASRAHELMLTGRIIDARSEEHTSELQSRENLVCRL